MTQQTCSLTTHVTETYELGYLLHLPPTYGKDPHQRWPLILFLHGAGERGNDLALVKKHGLPRIAEERGELPFIVVSPQCPQDTWWPSLLQPLLTLLDHVVAHYAVDTARVYLSGLSMGGYGTWALAAAHPERFAAIAPICGGGPWFLGFPQRVAALKDTPTWVFHGARDTVVRPRESRELVAVLKKCGGEVRFTVYPEAGHDAWTETYDNPELYAWFLSHHKPQG